MIKSCLVVFSLIAAACAIPIPGPISDASIVNATSGYNPGAAVSYAKANCNSGQGLCAEFASRSMAAGGAGNPIITWVPDLVNWMNKNGWKMIGTQCCGPAGSVVIYDETSAGNDHAAFSVGGGLICQHNPGRCSDVGSHAPAPRSTSGDWGTHRVYCYGC